MRPQQIHHSNDDRHCDSSSANDADVDNNKDDGGKQQRKTMQQQHSSAAIRTICFETTASSCLAKTRQQPAAQKVFRATAHSCKFLCQAFPAAAKSVAARRRHKGSTASTSHNPRAEFKPGNARHWLSSKVLIHKQSVAQSSNESDERPSGTLSSLGKDNPSGRQ